MFEVVDGDGEHQFPEFAVPSARPDSGSESVLDGREGTLGHPSLPVEIAAQPCVVGVVVVSEEPVSDDRLDAFGSECLPQRLIVIPFSAGETLDFVGVARAT